VFFVATGVLWAGYAVFAYSLSQVRGCNAGFLAMAWPGKATPVCNPDTGTPSATKTNKITGTPGTNEPGAGTAYSSYAACEKANPGATGGSNGNCKQAAGNKKWYYIPPAAGHN